MRTPTGIPLTVLEYEFLEEARAACRARPGRWVDLREIPADPGRRQLYRDLATRLGSLGALRPFGLALEARDRRWPRLKALGPPRPRGPQPPVEESDHDYCI